MPLIEVKLFDRRVTPEASARIIEKLTDALADACQDEGVKAHTQVIVQGVSPANWGWSASPASERSVNVAKPLVRGDEPGGK